MNKLLVFIHKSITSVTTIEDYLAVNTYRVVYYGVGLNYGIYIVCRTL